MSTDENRWFTLEQMPKENPFNAPTGYLETFPLHMAEKIRLKETEKVRHPLLVWSKPQKYALLSMASVTLLIMLGIWLYHPSGRPISSQELAEIMEYSIVSEMDETEIINQLDVANKKLTLSNDSIAKIDEGDSKQLIDYLSKEDIDVNTIVDAL